MTKLADSYYYYGDLSFFGDGGASARTRIAKFSPDGKRFTICVRRGHLNSNTNEFQLLLYDTHDVFASPTPSVLVSMSSGSNLDAIESVTWLGNNDTIAFVGAPDQDVRQVYTYAISSHQLAKLTDHPTNIRAFAASSNGDKVAFTAEEATNSMWDNETRTHGIVVSRRHSIIDLIRGRTDPTLASKLFFASREGTRPIGPKITVWGSPSLSPDGRYILIAERPTDVPADWKDYFDPKLRSFAQTQLRPGEPSLFHRFRLIDTVTGQDRILLNSPTGPTRGGQVAWSLDNRSIAISRIYLPLGNTDGAERLARLHNMFTVEVDIQSGDVRKVLQGDAEIQTWNSDGNELVLIGRQDRPGQRIAFHKRNGIWEEANRKEVEDHPEIILEEDMNNPPRIYALDKSNTRKSLLLDLNPQFRHLQFAAEEEVRWSTSTGEQVRGGLYYPLNYVRGKQYPLVIQTHGFLPDKFGIDGAYVAPFAAQPLASKDIVVLQLDEDYGQLDKTEVDREVDRIESAIEYLNKQHLVDITRVGIIGFSRTCLYVKYALTHSKYHFAAALAMDGMDAGYVPYILWGPSFSSFAALDESINGGTPFATELKTWLQRSPGFNTDKVTTPIRLLALNAASLLGEWEWFAALSLQNKPVELVYLQDAAHVMEMPSDRLVAQQGTLDWFCFWLKNEEDPDPAKRDQYVRWHGLRKLQQQSAEQAAPD